MQLKPLVCSGCSGAVPLGDGATTKCPFCGIDVPIPASHLALRDDDKAAIEARVLARKTLDDLASPFPLIVTVMLKLGTAAKYALIAMGVMGVVLGLIAGISEVGSGDGVLGFLFIVGSITILSVPLVWEWTLHALTSKLHVDLVDKLSGFGAHCLLGLAIVVFCLVPIAFAVYAAKVARVRGGLLGQFRANPPKRPGGPGLCRHCDAPLEVLPGAYGARCLYCGTDNLVATVSTQGTASRKHAEGAVHGAMETLHRARRDAVRSVRTAALVGLVLLPTCGGVGLLAELVIDNGYATPHTTRAKGAPMLYGEGPHHPPGDVTLECDNCEYYVPLQRGETLAVTGPEVGVERRQVTSWYHVAWEWVPLERGPVPYTGWYRIVASGHRGGKLHWSVQ